MPTLSPRDREILLDTALRLYAVRRPLKGEITNEAQLITECVSDAFDTAIAILHAEPDDIAKTLN